MFVRRVKLTDHAGMKVSTRHNHSHIKTTQERPLLFALILTSVFLLTEAIERSFSLLKFFDQRQNHIAKNLAQSLEGSHPCQDQTVSAQENRFVLISPAR